MEWELVSTNKVEELKRIKVEGGWLYRNRSIVATEEDVIVGTSESMCFVPEQSAKCEGGVVDLERA